MEFSESSVKIDVHLEPTKLKKTTQELLLQYIFTKEIIINDGGTWTCRMAPAILAVAVEATLTLPHPQHMA